MGNMLATPGINWGRGRLRPYESLGSFAAKVCALNKLQPASFRRFISACLGASFPAEAPDRLVTINLAKLLDEPLSVVQTIGLPILRAGGGLLSDTVGNNDEPNIVRACPLCIAEG
jgi:hypothetical protein